MWAEQAGQAQKDIEQVMKDLWAYICVCAGELWEDSKPWIYAVAIVLVALLILNGAV